MPEVPHWDIYGFDDREDVFADLAEMVDEGRVKELILRPKVPEVKMNSGLSVMLPEVLKDAVDASASLAGISMAEWVRRALLKACMEGEGTDMIASFRARVAREKEGEKERKQKE